MEKLSKRQEDVLRTIKKFIAKHGYPPTVREIGEINKLNSPATTHFHLSKLIEKGYLKRNSSKNRALELLVDNEYLKDDNVVEVALIGKVTAGNPIEAIEIPDEYFSVPTALIPPRAEVFALKVSGDSMIEAGIFDGDIALIERTSNAHNGEKVVAMTADNEVTLKTFYKEKDHIRLKPENKNMKDLVFNQIQILGKLVGLYRKI